MVNFNEMKTVDKEIKMTDIVDFQEEWYKYRKRRIPIGIDENNNDYIIINRKKTETKKLNSMWQTIQQQVNKDKE